MHPIPSLNILLHETRQMKKFEKFSSKFSFLFNKLERGQKTFSFNSATRKIMLEIEKFDSPLWRLNPRSWRIDDAKSDFCRAPSYRAVVNGIFKGLYCLLIHKVPMFSVAISWTICRDDSTDSCWEIEKEMRKTYRNLSKGSERENIFCLVIYRVALDIIER
jgi:hypothetical protein